MLTPQTLATNLTTHLHLNSDVFLKREDMHPLGSHKGRSIPPLIDHYVARGVTNFVISSSGNAGLAAALHIKELNQLSFRAKRRIRASVPEQILRSTQDDRLFTLTIFLGEKIDIKKLDILRFFCHSEEAQRPKNPLNSDVKRSFPTKSGTGRYTQDDNVRILQVANPKQQAIMLEKNTGAKYLRQSTDDLALLGYENLAKELAEIKNLAAVFIPTSSGTTAQGLYEGFKKLGVNPQIHIIQTTACHPIVDLLPNTSSYSPPQRGGDSDSPSIASAIVDKVAHRKDTVADVIKNSHGQGWIATNEEIQNAQNILLKTENITTSPNSALALVGLIKSLQAGTKFNGPVLCILTGK